MNFAQNLKFFRNNLFLTQEDLVNKTGISRSAISKYESGETEPRVSALLKLANALNCSLDELVKTEQGIVYKLCLVSRNMAYFTDSFEHQWGDDWDDVINDIDDLDEPYETWEEQIEEVITSHPIKIKKIFFETNEPEWEEKRPCDAGRYSIEDINKGAIAWLHTKKINIIGGMTYENFVDIIKQNGGEIYLPLGTLN